MRCNYLFIYSVWILTGGTRKKKFVYAEKECREKTENWWPKELQNYYYCFIFKV